MKKTANYGFNKPESSDYYDIEHFNENADKIDEQLKVAQTHRESKSNPHGVTKAQVGLGNVDNTADKDKPVSTAQKAAIDEAIAKLINGAPGTLDTLKEIADAMADNEDVVEALEKAIGERAKTADLNAHTGNKSNPHGVTKSQVGLGNVNNTSDADKPVSKAQQKAIDDAAAASTESGKNPTLESSTAAPFIIFKSKGATIQDGEPTPDAPQEIHGVGESGVLEVKSTGRNIFGGLPFAQALVDSGSTNVVLDTNAKTVTYQHNTNYQDLVKKVLFNEFRENTRYTIVLRGNHTQAVSGVEKRYTQLAVVYTDGTEETMLATNDGEFETMFYTDEKKSVKEITYHYYDIDKNVLYYEECGVFEGVITADEFEPYTETKANIPISAPLYDGDYIRYNMDGTGELVRKMASVVFDGSESWSNWTSIGLSQFYTIKSNALHKKDKVRVHSSHFIGITIDERENNYETIYTGLQSNTSYINVNTQVATTTAEWKAWLQANPIEVVYELAEPTVTPLTEEQIAEFEKLRTFDGVTHVTCEGECEVQYLTESESGKAVAAVVSKVNNGLDALEAAINKAIADLINGAPGTLDTLKEIADAMADNEDVVEALEKAIGERAKTADLNAHTGNKSNPHGVTKVQVGLGNVNNTSDADKPVSTAQQAAINKAIAYAKEVIAEFDYETGEISNAVEDNMTVPTAIDHLQAVISDIIGGVMANKENLELPVGSVIMMETGTGTNYELPKYGTWSYELTQIFEETSSGAAKAIHVKLYKRTS